MDATLTCFIDYNVVGVTFENRQKILEDFFKTYKVGGIYNVRLVHEPENPYDSNAVSVFLETSKDEYKNVGYISKHDNADLVENLPNLIKSTLLFAHATPNGKIGIGIRAEFSKFVPINLKKEIENGEEKK